MKFKSVHKNWKLIINFQEQSCQKLLLKKQIIKIFDSVINYLSVKNEGFLIVNFISKEEMKKINKNYYPFKKICDLLAIPLSNRFKTNFENPLGEIYICFEILKNQFSQKTISNIFFKKFIHSFLHLLKYDHLKEKNLFLMNKITEEIVNSLN